MSENLLYICLGAIGLCVVWFIGTYNKLIRLRNFTRESWAQIDTELKRRYDLIPNLINTVKGYAQHEQRVLEEVTNARSRAMASNGSPAAQAKDESQLVRALNHLMVTVENYPALKANENFMQLQKELVNTEDRIQAARRFFNSNIRDFNTCQEVFPSNLIAGLFGFKKAEYFEVEPTARAVPSASF